MVQALGQARANVTHDTLLSLQRDCPGWSVKVKSIFPHFFTHPRNRFFQVSPDTAMVAGKEACDNRRSVEGLDNTHVIRDKGVEIAGLVRDRSTRQILWNTGSVLLQPENAAHSSAR